MVLPDGTSLQGIGRGIEADELILEGGILRTRVRILRGVPGFLARKSPSLISICAISLTATIGVRRSALASERWR